jgi:peptidoglycan/LPS O-acetylase OafA/YrhL
MIDHGFYIAGPRGAGDLLTRLTAVGWVGVDLFFVLSGFLITGILVDTRTDPHYFRCFYARRTLRIFPIYYAVVVFLVFVAPAIHAMPRETARMLWHEQLWYWTYLTNVHFAIHPSPRLDALTGHFWSLAVEEQFYLFWPLVVPAVGERRLRDVALAAVAVAFLARIGLVELRAGTGWIYTMLPTRVDALAMGALVALAARQPRLATVARRWLPRLAAAGGATIVGVALSSRPHAFGFWSPLVEVLGYPAVDIVASAAVGVLVLEPTIGWFRRLCEMRWLREIGRVSYSLYVVHLPLMNACIAWAGGRPSAPVPAIHRFLFVAVSMLLSVGLALLTWRFIERPFLELKRFFSYGSRSGEAAREAA